jgi:hypothetical protein
LRIRRQPTAVERLFYGKAVEDDSQTKEGGNVTKS